MNETLYPEINVQLVGENGNAFAILRAVQKALRGSGVSEEQVQKFRNDATSGDYDHLLTTAMKWVNVE